MHSQGNYFYNAVGSKEFSSKFFIHMRCKFGPRVFAPKSSFGIFIIILVRLVSTLASLLCFYLN